MSGLVLRLAGPLQSWGEHSTFSERDTLPFPTRSGLLGMFAAAQGLSRGQSLGRYAPLKLTVRIDRPGTLLRDFHTVGGGLPRARTVPTASGGRRPAGKGTVVTRRWYLSDAVFAVAAEGPASLVEEIAGALRVPHWQPYLGRRCCPPDQPLFLRVTSGDPATDLRETLPLPKRRTGGSDHITVGVITETPAGEGPVTDLTDVPGIAGRLERRYGTRAVYQAQVQVPVALADWRNAALYHQALHDYARRTS